MIGYGILLVASTAIISYLGSSNDNFNWYKKAPLTPPNWVFGVIWPILWILLAIGIELFFNNAKTKALFATILIINLIFVASWTWAFSYMRNLELSSMIIMISAISSIMLCIVCWYIYKPTLYFILPYTLWLCFATYLNLYSALNN